MADSRQGCTKISELQVETTTGCGRSFGDGDGLGMVLSSGGCKGQILGSPVQKMCEGCYSFPSQKKIEWLHVPQEWQVCTLCTLGLGVRMQKLRNRCNEWQDTV